MTLTMASLLVPLLSIPADPGPRSLGVPGAVHSLHAGRSLRAASPQHARRPIETPNFSVYQRGSPLPAREAAAQWERLRGQLRRQWLGVSAGDWKPRCQVVLHATRASYLRAVGPSGEHTKGSSLVEVAGERIITRRIDLCCESPAHPFDAFPHELTHVVLADRFSHPAPPPWADEGMAVLADSAEKQRLHRRDFVRSLAEGRALRVQSLFSLPSCPPGEARATFYGQSASLVGFLVQRDSPHRFVQFIEQATRIGYDRALAETYGIQGTLELERIMSGSLLRTNDYSDSFAR